MIDEQLEAEIMALKTDIDMLDSKIYGLNSRFSDLSMPMKKAENQILLAKRALLVALREKQAILSRNY